MGQRPTSFCDFFVTMLKQATQVEALESKAKKKKEKKNHTEKTQAQEEMSLFAW